MVYTMPLGSGGCWGEVGLLEIEPPDWAERPWIREQQACCCLLSMLAKSCYALLKVLSFPSCLCHILVIFSRCKFSIMNCKVLSSELSLANVIILSIKNQLTRDRDCPHYSHITKILEDLIEKLSSFIVKLYRYHM